MNRGPGNWGPENWGPVIWIAAGWQGERLLPDGLCDFAEPGRVIFVTARHAPDLLWAMEEALRSGAAPLVIADLPEPPALTPVRRLQLATEAGARVAPQAPLGLMLTPGAGGAAGAHSRWQMTATPDGWRLDRLRARMAPPASWHLKAGAGGKGGVISDFLQLKTDT